MNKLDILLLALKNFTRRMARSILTIVGVIIGSMAIIVMVSLGIGIQESMMLMIERWGDLTTINVYLWNLQSDGGYAVARPVGGGVSVVSSSGGGSSSKNQNKKNPYFEAMENVETLDHVLTAMPLMYSSVRLVSGRYVAPWASIYLIDASKLHYFNIKASRGRLLEEGDGEFAIMLSNYIGQEFINLRARNPYDWSKRPMDEFGNIIPYVDIYNDEIKMTFDDRYGEKPIYGEATRRKAKLYDVDVVGFQDDMGNFGWMNMMNMESFVRLKKEYLKNLMKGMSKDEASMYQYQLDQLERFDQMYVKVDDRNNVADVVKQIRDLGYECYSNMESVEQVNNQMAVIQLVMGAIGAVALLVAAINIANTMIMSIYERTKEIGIMKVIGCRLGDICTLFLSEAGILGVIGGVIGIAAS